MQGIVTDEALRPCLRSCVSLDQVWYTEFSGAGGRWHMGAVEAGWEAQLSLTSLPGEEELKGLAERGIWLAKDADKKPPVCVMCCGQGSIWPGMGRELYDYFPEARAAMDRLAACTNWDVLSLMDEPNVETIGLTQWAQPYLFLLEYAQWSVFLSRGLDPSCLCGHSLGELIALCLAGVYTPETCWYILETRSRHVSEMEARSRRETGMMGVYAGLDVINELRSQWPDIYISNYNTPEQFIVSGPREVLKEARKHLRRQRIPAVILNIAMAFHHPSMRVLRDMDSRRLGMLDMVPSKRPLVSCVTAEEYPRTHEGICTAIMDLDENTVNWLPCVDAIYEKRGIRHFLELGPQDTLCGLVSAIKPDAFCQPASSRGRERDCMRQALARLYSLGLLPHNRLVQVAQNWQPMPEARLHPAMKETEAELEAEAKTENVGIPELRSILAEASGLPAESLHGSMDLRFDLHLRSSYFPSLIDQAQKALGVEVSFEELLTVSTIADLERVFKGEPVQEEAAGPVKKLGSLMERPFLARCDCSEEAVQEEGKPAELGEDPARAVELPGIIAVHGRDDALCAALVRTISSMERQFLLDGPMPETRRVIEGMGSTVLADSAWQDACQEASKADFMLWQGLDGEAESETVTAIAEDKDAPFLMLVERLPESGAEGSEAKGVLAEGSSKVLAVRIGQELESRQWNDLQLGDLVLRELRAGRHGAVCWTKDSEAALLQRSLKDNADSSPMVFPARSGLFDRHSAADLWEAQFSPELVPSLKDLPKDGEGWSTLPLSLILEAHREAAILASPGLACLGMCDIRVQGKGEVRQGLVREMRLVTDIRPWLKNDGGMNRFCRVQSSLRGMSRTRRSSFQYEEMPESCVILAGHAASPERLWEDPAVESGQELDLAQFYKTAGIGQGRHFLASARLDGGHMLRAELAEEAFLALHAVSAYNSKLFSDCMDAFSDSGRRHLCALEAVLQAVELARSVDAPSTQCEALPGLIGFVRFGQVDEGPYALSLKRSWDQDRVLRYDAQVTNAKGQCLLVVMHIEYNALA